MLRAQMEMGCHDDGASGREPGARASVHTLALAEVQNAEITGSDPDKSPAFNPLPATLSFLKFSPTWNCGSRYRDP